MAHYSTSIRSSLSPTEAFGRFADLANISDWDPGVATSTQVVGTGPGPDAEYDVTLSSAGRMTLRYVTTDFTAAQSVTYRASAALFTSIDVISVEPSGDGCVLTYDATLRLPLLLRLGDPVMGIVFRRIGDAAADGLRKALDGEFVA